MPLTIHRFESDLLRFGGLYAPTDADGEWMFAVNGRPLQHVWTIPAARIIDDDPRNSTVIGDITNLGSTPVLSRRAVETLGKRFERYGELLPLRTDAGELFVYNVTNIVDCLDRANTPGLWLDADRLARADHYEFVRERVQPGIFKIPEQLSGPAFVTSDILAEIEQARLTAFACPQVWPDPVMS